MFKIMLFSIVSRLKMLGGGHFTHDAFVEFH